MSGLKRPHAQHNGEPWLTGPLIFLNSSDFFYQFVTSSRFLIVQSLPPSLSKWKYFTVVFAKFLHFNRGKRNNKFPLFSRFHIFSSPRSMLFFIFITAKSSIVPPVPHSLQRFTISTDGTFYSPSGGNR